MPHYFTCEFCGETFEDSKNAYRNPRFCSLNCWHDSKRVVNTCNICGKTFKTTKHRRRKYCSKECRLEGGWGTKADPAKHSVFTCDWCGKEFETWTYRNPTHCSSQCRSEFGARQPKPNLRKPEIHITLICQFCGNEYQTTTHQLRLRGSRFCSIDCQGAAKSMAMRGENNPMWTGGTLDVSQYGPNWGRQSRKAKKRDKSTCQICGYLVGGDRILDVHHIIKIREFNGDWRKANRLSNLISLCRPCHKKVEHGFLACPNPEHLPGNALG